MREVHDLFPMEKKFVLSREDYIICKYLTKHEDLQHRKFGRLFPTKCRQPCDKFIFDGILVTREKIR